MDALDFWSRNELLIISRERRGKQEAEKRAKELTELMGNSTQTYLDIALDYVNTGLWFEAKEMLLRLVPDKQIMVYPMLVYTLGYIAEQLGDDAGAREFYQHAIAMPPDFCFPVRLEEMIILQHALEFNVQDARAHYYLGNLLYDKRRYNEAIEHWERACELEPGFSIPWRNLGIGYYNVRKDPTGARECYLKAFEANQHDPRLLYELDQLMMKLGEAPIKRLARLEQHLDLVEQRDYLAITRVALYNQLAQPQKALELLHSHRFFPWEGGEGTVSGEYVTAHLMLGRAALGNGQGQAALAHFQAAQQYPENLGEGKCGTAVDTPCKYG
jgi:tetratricopeptide (TPR) repeat protein